MAINRALMNRQMYNMGGPSLQAGAPDITLTGDMRPTYSAMRKQRLAYGGIAGADGRKNYGIGSFFQEKIMDPIKNNPITSAVIGGGLLNQFGVPDFLTKIPGVGQYIDPDFGQNFLGDLINKDLVIGEGGEQTVGRNMLGDLDPNNTTGWMEQGLSISPQEFLSGAGNSILSTATDAVKNVVSNAYQSITGGGGGGGVNLETPEARDAYRLQQQKQSNLNSGLIKALGIGSAAGAYVDSQPKDVLPTDTTGLDIPAITAAAQGSDAQAKEAGLRFTPQQETRLNPVAAAEGGRIGYANGTPDPVIPENFLNDVDKIIEAYMKSQEGMFFLKDEINKGKSMGQIIDQMKKELEQQNPSSMGDMDPGFTIPGPPQSPNATPIPEGMMINPRKTMEFRDVNQNGIPDRDEGIYSKDRDFVPKKDFPNMDPGFIIPRVTRAEGGLMDLGGMEKDYREDGGFVPIGGREKADDVPARLSKNEFVFTADAVRNAGGGDIDQGAQVMERLMKSLESGGQVSEESQGLDGAREMFETSQRLEKRII